MLSLPTPSAKVVELTSFVPENSTVIPVFQARFAAPEARIKFAFKAGTAEGYTRVCFSFTGSHQKGHVTVGFVSA